MKAKEFLRQIQKADRMIENKLIEKEQWKSVALGTTAHIQTAKIGGVVQGLDRVQQSGSQNKMADAVERYIDIETDKVDRQLNRIAAEQGGWRARVMRTFLGGQNERIRENSGRNIAVQKR